MGGSYRSKGHLLGWISAADLENLSQRAALYATHARGEGTQRAYRAACPAWRHAAWVADGRWFDPLGRIWRDGRGKPARWPDLEMMIAARTTRVVLAAAHLNHNTGISRWRNLRAFCQRCHLIHDRPPALVITDLSDRLGEGEFAGSEPSPRVRLPAGYSRVRLLVEKWRTTPHVRITVPPTVPSWAAAALIVAYGIAWMDRPDILTW